MNSSVVPSTIVLQIPRSGHLILADAKNCKNLIVRPSKDSSGNSSGNSAAVVSPRFSYSHLASISVGGDCGKVCLAVHISGNYVAFVGSSRSDAHTTERGMTTSSPQRNAGLLHIMNIVTGQELHLSSVVRGTIQDIAFAHLFDRIVLAVVDTVGNVAVIEIKEAPDKFRSLTHSCLLELLANPKLSGNPSEHHRVKWCPYVATSEDDPNIEDFALVLFAVHNTMVDIFSLKMVAERYGSHDVSLDNVRKGRKQIGLEHAIELVDPSPDGTALAVLDCKGIVWFYDYDLESNLAPRHIQSWRPLVEMNISGEINSMDFLDDRSRKVCVEDTFWRFVVVGYQEAKVTKLALWSCSLWRCFQTVTLDSERFFTAVDPTGRFVVLAAVETPLMLVFRFKSAKDDESVHFDSVWEIPLNFSFRSLVIRNATSDGNQDVIEMFGVHKSGVCFCKVSLGDEVRSAFAPVQRALFGTGASSDNGKPGQNQAGSQVEIIEDIKTTAYQSTKEVSKIIERKILAEQEDNEVPPEGAVINNAGDCNRELSEAVGTGSETGRCLRDIHAELIDIKEKVSLSERRNQEKEGSAKELLRQAIEELETASEAGVSRRMDEFKKMTFENMKLTLTTAMTDIIKREIPKIVEETIASYMSQYTKDLAEKCAKEVEKYAKEGEKYATELSANVARDVQTRLHNNLMPELFKNMENNIGQ